MSGTYQAPTTDTQHSPAQGRVGSLRESRARTLERWIHVAGAGVFVVSVAYAWIGWHWRPSLSALARAETPSSSASIPEPPIAEVFSLTGFEKVWWNAPHDPSKNQPAEDSVAKEATLAALKLLGILHEGCERFAYVYLPTTDRLHRVHAGEKLQDYVVSAIEDRAIRLQRAGVEVRLGLTEEAPR